MKNLMEEGDITLTGGHYKAIKAKETLKAAAKGGGLRCAAKAKERWPRCRDGLSRARRRQYRAENFARPRRLDRDPHRLFSSRAPALTRRSGKSRRKSLAATPRRFPLTLSTPMSAFRSIPVSAAAAARGSPAARPSRRATSGQEELLALAEKTARLDEERTSMLRRRKIVNTKSRKRSAGTNCSRASAARLRGSGQSR